MPIRFRTIWRGSAPAACAVFAVTVALAAFQTAAHPAAAKPAPPGEAPQAAYVSVQDRPVQGVPAAGMVHPQVQLLTPLPGGEATSPLLVEGRARGAWFFEASFAVRLFVPDGRELGVAVAQAQAPWMTDRFVPFEAELEFDAPPDACLVLVLEKANPSDLREHDDEVRIGLRCPLEK